MAEIRKKEGQGQKVNEGAAKGHVCRERNGKNRYISGVM
jgi:hypothetical protein